MTPHSTAPPTRMIPRPARLPLVALLAANAISLVGTALTALAIPWFVLQTTGSAARTGLSGFVGLVPLVLGGLLGGTVVDRLGPKRASVMSDVASGIAIAAIPLLHGTVGLAFWQLLALQFLANLCETPGGTARMVLLPDLATSGGLALGRVNAAAEATRRLSHLLGPPLAGLLIAVLGPSNVLWLDAATFACSAAAIALAVPATARGRSGRGEYLAETLEGLRFLRADRLVRALIALFAASNALLNPLFLVLLPVYAAATTGRALDLGLLIAAFGGGTLAGAALFGAVGGRAPRRALLVGALALTGLPLWPLAALPPARVTMGLLAAMGLALGPLGPLVLTVLGERTPGALRGRVFGAYSALVTAAIPPGVLLAGVLTEIAGVRAVLLGMAVAYLALVLAALALPVFRQLSPTGADAGRPTAARDQADDGGGEREAQGQASAG